MVLRRLMGWEMIDLTYSVMMETKKGVLRWDNQTLVDVPKFDSLPQWVSLFCRARCPVLTSMVICRCRVLLVLSLFGWCTGTRSAFFVTRCSAVLCGRMGAIF